jgi:hypothetical protein
MSCMVLPQATGQEAYQSCRFIRKTKNYRRVMVVFECRNNAMPGLPKDALLFCALHTAPALECPNWGNRLSGIPASAGLYSFRRTDDKTDAIDCAVPAAVALPALARLAGPLQVGQPSQVRDLAQIRSSQVLRVLVNQSRNSSGEVQGQSIGVEYHRLRAFEHYLNGHARDGQEITLKIIPKAKDQLLGAVVPWRRRCGGARRAAGFQTQPRHQCQ